MLQGFARRHYPLAPLRSPRNAWTAASMRCDPRWTFTVNAALQRRDMVRLRVWAQLHPDRMQSYEHGCLDLPRIFALGAQVRRELRWGTGVAHIKGFDPALDDDLLRLAHLALGLCTGSAITDTSRLCDVRDRCEDHRTGAVSMTRKSTSFHTDSGERGVEPEHIGLLCLRPAIQGGETLVTSAATVHEALRGSAPQHLQVLYRDFARDAITRGTDRNLDRIRENGFPVFRFDADRGEPVLRYQRYCIERAHQLIAAPLSDRETGALDHLDALLADPQFVLEFALQRGEMLWIDNRTIAHNRGAYEEVPDEPRLLVRMWTGDAGASYGGPRFQGAQNATASFSIQSDNSCSPNASGVRR